MKQTITEDEFIRAFDDHDRSQNFTVAARRAMFEYFEEYEKDTGVQIELDVVAICCEFSEHANEEEVREAYGLEEDADIEYYTHVIPVYTFDTTGPVSQWRDVQTGIVIRDW